MKRLLSADNPLIPPTLRPAVRNMLEAKGIVWANETGFVTIAPLAGLPHLLEFVPWVRPDLRRRGHGTIFLRHVATHARSHFPDATQLTAFVGSMEQAEGQFFEATQFVIHHEELLFRHALQYLPSETGNLRTLPFADAVETFIQLYDASFAEHPWYQPFSEEEVWGSLDEAENMLFLFEDSRAIGFVWLNEADEGYLLEPIGVLPAYQGKGLGRRMVQAALTEINRRGKRSAQLGVWAENKTAVTLYKSLGFTYTNGRYILNYPLRDS